MKNLASIIDHTLLAPDATKEDITRLCEEAIEHKFAAVCVAPYFVGHAAKRLENTKVAVCAVVGFPFGYGPTFSKVSEAKWAIDNGAKEVDAAINRSAYRSGDLSYVENEIESISTIVRFQDGIVKIIIEGGELSVEEVEQLCRMCAEQEVDFVKTSTGFSTNGVTIDLVKLMRKTLPKKVKVKASGGIRTRKFALELIEAGADRLGCSRSLDIIQE
jgi:deoxyribose-phosphate aldolase